MKILMITPYLPYPPSSGGQVRSYNLIKQLYKKHDIILFCYIRADREKKFIPELEKYCKKVKVFKRREAWSLLNVVLAGFSPYPFLVGIYLSGKFRDSVKQELEKTQYDLIHCETFYVMTNIPRTSLPTILVDQTIEYLVYQHFVKSKPSLVRLLLNVDVAKLKFWERHFWRKASKVVAVSEGDREEMLRLDPDLRADLVPNGVDLDFFIPKKNWDTKEKRMLFVGNFKWLQNVEAAEILVNEIFPKVKSKFANVKLWIVGQHAPERVLALKGKDIIIDNLEESDVEGIRNAYNKASVFVAPVKGPGGTRLKNLAAMASKLPIVTTSIGSEGIGIREGIEALIRDGADDISDAIVEILRNPKEAKTLAENARKLAEKEYSWETMAKRLDVVYREATRR